MVESTKPVRLALVILIPFYALIGLGNLVLSTATAQEVAPPAPETGSDRPVGGVDAQDSQLQHLIPRGLRQALADQLRKVDGKLSPTELYRRVSPSVVRVDVYDERKRTVSQGSGFFVSRDGLIATNLHVLSRGSEAAVSWGKNLAVPVVGVVAYAQARDLAILKIDHPNTEPLELALDLPPIGTAVFALGTPRGLENTISDGMISGHRRTSDGGAEIQMTTPISAGSSGGPLVLDTGVVVGVVYSQFVQGQNLNFAIPASEIRDMLRRCHEPKTLAAVTQEIYGGHRPAATIQDDNEKLAAVAKSFESGDLRSVLRVLNEIPETRRGASYWATVGRAHWQLRNFQSARDSYRKSLELQPANSETLGKLALVCRCLGLETEGVVEEAGFACKAASRLDPLSAEPHSILGILWGTNDARIAHLKTAVTLDPDHLAAHNNLAVLYMSERDFPNAVKHYLRVLELMQNSAEYEILPVTDPFFPAPLTRFTQTESIEVLTYLGLGTAYSGLGDTAKASAAFRFVLKKEPNNGLAKQKLGMLFGPREGPAQFEWVFFPSRSAHCVVRK